MLEAPRTREDCRFVQLQLTVLLQGCASVEGGGEAYRTLIVSGNSTLYETAQAISAAFGLIDAADTAKPLPPKLECIFEDVFVAEDGLTIENRGNRRDWSGATTRRACSTPRSSSEASRPPRF